MKYLLDTQSLIWSLLDNPRPGNEARSLVMDPDHDMHVSAASVWEMAIKASLGKLKLPAAPDRWMPEHIAPADFVDLPVTARHGIEAGGLPRHHPDPFNRLLIAQARLEGLTVWTVDSAFEEYDVRVRMVSRR